MFLKCWLIWIASFQASTFSFRHTLSIAWRNKHSSENLIVIDKYEYLKKKPEFVKEENVKPEPTPQVEPILVWAS